MTKYLWAAGAGVILIFMLSLLFPVILVVISTTNTTANASWGNFTGLGTTIRLTPLLLWVGVGLTPVVVIAVIAWTRKRQGG